jgi:CheY-like chemotaxis protein
MSHEIRTPLNAILGFAALARERQHGDPELRRQIGLIEKAGQALLTVINDVLDLSKIEAGKIELEERPLVLRTLVEDCLSLTCGLAKQKQLSLRCVVAPEIPARIMADEARLRQVLLNLLNNAVKFTPSGSVVLSVEPSPAAGRMTISVSDTGIGIAPDRIPHLFQDFMQVDGSISRHYGGTGLGLSISRRLVALMGGEVGVSSVVGQGSTFHVELPIQEAPVETPLMESPPSSARPVTPRRILLVDDLAINLEIVGEMLAAAGHHVSSVGSGPAAISAYRAERHDLILMDVQMPDMDGLEATRRIRNLDARGRAVPVIALTANVFSQQIASYREAGMNDHLGKPFHRDGLLAMVDRWTGDGMAELASGVDDTLAEPPAPVLDRERHDELMGLIGPEKVLDLVSRLREDLRERLRSAAPDALRADAHSMVSTAGLLGFAELSAAARTLEQAIADDGEIAVPLTRLLAARTAALAAMASLSVASSQPRLIPSFIAGQTRAKA